jgi:hypothetical protein
MNDEPAWFAPKRFGYGAGLPISWQGWALTLGYVAISIGTAALFAQQPLVLIAVLVPLTVALMVIAARTTKGGWRWRWGDED